MDIAVWLRSLGLGQYEAAFRKNAVDASVLPDLTAEDLREMGVTAIGHRRKLLAAAAALRAPSVPGAAAVPEPSPAPPIGPSAFQSALERGAGSAERRQLTVLFCDLAGSMALSARLDPEDLREVMASYHRAVTEAVQGQGGYVAKFLGDGVLAYFGWPQAYEDDAERAVRAGLAAVAAVAGLRAGSEALAARVGLATGLVVVGDVLGEGAARERGVVGETPNLAERLQALAEPGAVVADAATRRLTGGLFAWAELGEVALKGVNAPVSAFRALGESGIESRFEALRAGNAAPLIGREEELELLLRRWRRARTGEGQVVVVRGEAGIGKSRLTAALQEALQAEEHESFILYCSPQHTDSPLHPVIARLERAAGLVLGEAPEERLAKLEALLTPDEPPEDVALIAELLSVPTLGRWPSLDLSPQRRRERLLQALLRRVRALAARRPVLMILEDAHWADPSTREWLDLLVAEAPGMALLLLITHRPEFDPGAWIGQPHVSPVQLNRLAAAEHRALLRGVAGKALPAEVETEILSHTDGVPLFVEEVTRAVLESGLLREEAERWVLDGSLPALAVPASLQASLVARLDRLSSVREVAQAGAVLGREFAHDLLAAVTGLSEPALCEALERLAAADLIQRRGTPPEASYTFRHALIQDAAHATLLRERRRELHRCAAAAIERLRPDATEREPEVLAHHRAEAGEAKAAVALYLKAGERSAARSADREAVSHLRRGLEILAGLPASPERDRLELNLQLAIGTPLIALHGWSGQPAAAAYERASTLCESLGGDEQLGVTLFGLASNRVVRGQTRVAQQLATRCRALAERRRNPVDQLLAHRAAGVALMQLGELQAARAEFEAIPALYDPARDRNLASRCVTDPLTTGLSFLALVLLIMGHPDQARRTADEAERCAAALGHANTTAHVLCRARGECAQLLRDVPSTRRHAEVVLALAAEHDMSMWRGYGLVLCGWTLAEEGRAQDGASLIRQGIGELDALGTVLHHTHHLGLLAGIEGGLGNPAAGLRVLDEAYDEVARTEVRLFEAELRRIEGRLWLLSGQPDEAERCLAAATEVARQQEARFFELCAACGLARLWRDQGRLAEARGLLAPVCAYFVEDLAFPDLVEARALLKELDPSVASPQPVSPSGREAAAMPR